MKLCNSFFTFWKLHKCQHSLNVNWTYFNIYNSNDSSTFKSRPFKFLSHRRTSKRWYDKFWPFTILSSKHKANDQLKFPCWHNGRNLNGLGLSLRNRKLWKKTRRGHVAHTYRSSGRRLARQKVLLSLETYFRWKLFNSRLYFGFRKLFVKAKRPRTYDTLSFQSISKLYICIHKSSCYILLTITQCPNDLWSMT